MRLPFFSFEKRKEKKNRYVLYYEKSVSSIAKGGELFTVGEFAQRRERRVGVEKTHRVGIDLRDLFPFQSFPFLLLVVCLSLSSFRCKRSLVPFCGDGASKKPPPPHHLFSHSRGKFLFTHSHVGLTHGWGKRVWGGGGGRLWKETGRCRGRKKLWRLLPLSSLFFRVSDFYVGAFFPNLLYSSRVGFFIYWQKCLRNAVSLICETPQW